MVSHPEETYERIVSAAKAVAEAGVGNAHDEAAHLSRLFGPGHASPR